MDFSILVNKKNPLANNYVPANLVDTGSPNLQYILDPNQKILVVDEVLKAFKCLQLAASNLKYYIDIASGYRSYEYQQKIIDHYLTTKGEEWISQFVAKPGESEHQTGFAIDLLLIRDGKLIPDMYDTDEEVIWIHQNAHKYGFILRYPKGKEKITGYNYEPWHLRYVGLEIAQELYNKNLTLEEYHKEKDNL